MDAGPPDTVVGARACTLACARFCCMPTLCTIACAELGTFLHPCEDEMVFRCIIPDQVPYFNAPAYLENKTKIGKVDEIFGTPTNLASCRVTRLRGAPADRPLRRRCSR